MKFLITVCAVLAVASAQFRGFAAPTTKYATSTPNRPSVVKPSSNDGSANVLRYDNDVGPDGTYTYNVEIDNGISAQAQGTPRDFGGNPPLVPVVAQGTFSWTSPEGEPISISYVADENGYQPQGSALPTPPPVPEQIARALEYISKIKK